MKSLCKLSLMDKYYESQLEFVESWGDFTSYKIAVASSDGKVVNQHFGRTKQFLIFEVKDNVKYTFLGNREAIPPCIFGEHSDHSMTNAVNALSDCSFVLASQIGPVAENALSEKGIFAVSLVDFIEDAITKIKKG